MKGHPHFPMWGDVSCHLRQLGSQTSQTSGSNLSFPGVTTLNFYPFPLLDSYPPICQLYLKDRHNCGSPESASGTRRGNPSSCRGNIQRVLLKVIHIHSSKTEWRHLPILDLQLRNRHLCVLKFCIKSTRSIIHFLRSGGVWHHPISKMSISTFPSSSHTNAFYTLLLETNTFKLSTCHSCSPLCQWNNENGYK